MSPVDKETSPRNSSHRSSPNEHQPQPIAQPQNEIPPMLVSVVESLKEISTYEASKIGIITKVNGIKQRLYHVDEFETLQDSADLERAAVDLNDAFNHITSFDSLLADEIRVH